MASRYHMADRLLAAAGTTSGLYRSKVESVVGGLRERLLHFSALLLHRLVEERRFAVLLTEIEDGNDVYMTRDPQSERPDNEMEGQNIAKWSAADTRRLKAAYKAREAKTKELDRGLRETIEAVGRSAGWLEEAVPIYAAHMEFLDGMSPDPASRERKDADRDESLRDPDFDPKPPGTRWRKRDLFADRPEASQWSLREWANIYKHGGDPDRLGPMSIHRGNHPAAALLDHRMDEMKSKSAAEWGLDMAKDEEGEYPAFLDAAWGLLKACKAAITDSELLLAEEWEKIDRAGRGELRMTGAKKRPKKTKKTRWDWTGMAEGIKEKSHDDRLERQIRKYKRDKRGRFAK